MEKFIRCVTLDEDEEEATANQFDVVTMIGHRWRIVLTSNRVLLKRGQERTRTLVK